MRFPWSKFLEKKQEAQSLIAVPGSLNEKLLQAVLRQDALGVQDALKKGANIKARTKQGESVLHLWARRSDRYINEQSVPETLRVLLQAGANANARDNEGNTPIFGTLDLPKQATYRRQCENPTWENVTVLDMAYAKGDYKSGQGMYFQYLKAQLLIEKRGNCDAKNKKGERFSDLVRKYTIEPEATLAYAIKLQPDAQLLIARGVPATNPGELLRPNLSGETYVDPSMELRASAEPVDVPTLPIISRQAGYQEGDNKIIPEKPLISAPTPTPKPVVVIGGRHAP